MYDQSFGFMPLLKCLRKSDFYKFPDLRIEKNKIDLILSASEAAHATFEKTNPLQSFHLLKRTLYKIPNFAHEIVIRKIGKNLRHATRKKVFSRDFIASNVITLTKEGVPYTVYRLDIKSFFESVNTQHLVEKIKSTRGISQLTQTNLFWLLQQHAAIGGSGLPRGLSISSILAELTLDEFDTKINNHVCVYYYSRYVDDIIIITSGLEEQNEFSCFLNECLPPGLTFNTKKTKIASASSYPEWQDTIDVLVCNFDYLGYNIKIFDPCPPTRTAKQQAAQRKVVVDISSSKIAKYKTRIARSFLDFSRTHDFALLRDRVKLLTSNFSIYDRNIGRNKLSGIYYSYQLLTPNSNGLSVLDNFLENAIRSKSGRIFSQSAALLSSKHRTELLGYKFSRGHATRKFNHFSSRRIAEVQNCWINE